MEKSIEEIFGELDQIVEKLEASGTTLEESFASYEAGMKLVKACGEKIDHSVYEETEEAEAETDYAEVVKETAADVAETVAEKVGEAAEKAADKAGDVADKVAEKAKDAAEKMKSE